MEELVETIEKLLARYEQAKSRNVSLENELAATRELLESHISRIEILEKKINDLELAQAFADPDRKSAAGKKISRMIQEIDYCIELLEE